MTEEKFTVKRLFKFFNRAQARRGDVRRLLAISLVYWRRLAIAAVCMSIASLLGLALPWVIQKVIDDVLKKGDYTLLNQIISALFFIFLVQMIFNFGQTYLLSYISERIVADLRLRLYRHISRLSINYFTTHRTGDTISRITNDVNLVQNALTANIISTVAQVIQLIGGLTLVFILDWRLTIVTMSVIPVVAVTAMFYGRRIKKVTTEVQEQVGNITSFLEETIGGIRIVKAFGRESYEVGRFDNEVERTFQISLRRIRLTATLSPLIMLVVVLSILLVLWFGVREVLNGHLTSGQLVSYLIYMMMVASPIGQLTSIFSQLQQALAGAGRIFELLDSPIEVADLPGAQPLPPVKGNLRFEHVSFSYGDNDVVLDDLSFEIAPGEMVALVGPSGAGKSTIVNLILRFYDPTAGRITLDGYDLKEIQAVSLREQMAVVPQEPLLFGTTVAANISYGKLEATLEEIEAAARAANAREFISALPDGYESLVGERGVKLSGGQRQRLSIARAVLKDPRILILDEATSSLDNESEYIVQEALDRLMVERTTLVIAHRLSTIERADKIIVLDHGQIIEIGNHEALMAREGLYHRLYTRRFTDLLEPGEVITLLEVPG